MLLLVVGNNVAYDVASETDAAQDGVSVCHRWVPLLLVDGVGHLEASLHSAANDVAESVRVVLLVALTNLVAIADEGLSEDVSLVKEAQVVAEVDLRAALSLHFFDVLVSIWIVDVGGHTLSEVKIANICLQVDHLNWDQVMRLVVQLLHFLLKL